MVHSVTRSHRDGSVAIALVNIGAEPYKGRVPIDPGLRAEALAKIRPQATLLQMDGEGRQTPLTSQDNPWLQPVELQPRQVLVLVLR